MRPANTFQRSTVIGSQPSVSASPPTAAVTGGASCCHQCGAAYNKPTAKFCSRCGSKKTTAPPPPSAPSTIIVKKQHAPPPSSSSPPPPTTTPTTTTTGGGGGGGRTKGSHEAVTSPVEIPSRLAAAGATVTASSKQTLRPSERMNNNNNNNNNHNNATQSRKPLTPLGLSEPSVLSTPEETEGSSPTGGRDTVTRTLSVLEDTTVYKTVEIKETPEQEQKYNAWATLKPTGLTPDMLETENSPELAGWKKGTLIGRGTYGSVYLGLLGDGSFYAVKCVELGKEATEAINPAELVSLSREINMMQRLRHKNLCEFKGVWYNKEERQMCMFMQYVGGGSLTSFVKKFKPLPPDVVRTWTKQLLSGLLYLHAQHIIHRDIKGENVLVDTSVDPSSGAQIKLVDFGAARRLTDAVSQSKTVIGTPYWMAPEVVDFTGDGGGYSYKADVWSVGCTVAEMLTGSPPWPTRANAPSTIMMIATSKNGPTEIPEKEATPGCLAFMKRCFVIDPTQRPTVEELLRDPWILGKVE